MTSGANAFFSAMARAPLLRLALPFVVGIVAAMCWPLPLWPLAVVLVVLTVATAVIFLRRAVFGRRWVRGVASAAWFMVFGMCWQLIRDPLTKPTHVAVDGTAPVERIIHITAINGVSEKVVRADGRVVASLVAGEMHERTGQVMLTLMRRSDAADPVAGDELAIRSRMEPITRIPDPGGFDRRAWAASRGMYHETFAGTDDWSVIGHAWQWTDLFEPTRQRISDWLKQSGLPLRERALVKALVLGLRDELDHEQKDAFVKSGTVHVLAVSGTHVGFIYAMLVFMFGWWGGSAKARIGRGIIILLALWGYAGLTGACPSVLRATIMFSLFTLAGMTERRNEPLNSLFAAALLLLLWEPHMLIEIGFQLSFLAVLGIILFYGPLLRLWVPGGRFVGYLWSLTAVSLAAQVLTTPLSLYLFKAFPVWFLPANLIVVYVAGIAVYGAVALLVLFRVPYLGPLITFLLSILLMVVDRVTVFFAELPGAYPAIRTTFMDMALLYAIAILLAVRLMWKWRPALRLSLAAIALLLTGWGYRAHQAQDHVSFTVYDDRQALQVAMTVGRELTVLSPTADSLSPWLAQKAERHARSLGVHGRHVIGKAELSGRVGTEQGGTLCGAGRWSAPGLDVHFHHGESGRPEAARSDVLVLHDLRYLSGSDLEMLATDTRQVVLAGGLPWELRSFVQGWCMERKIPCHDVRGQGAFVMDRQV